MRGVLGTHSCGGLVLARIVDPHPIFTTRLRDTPWTGRYILASTRQSSGRQEPRRTDRERWLRPC